MRSYTRLIVLLTTGILPSVAGSLVYTSSTAWQASSPGSSTVLDFESATPGFHSSFSDSVFTFTAGSGFDVIAGGAAAGTGSGNYLTTDFSTVENIGFSAGVYGFAFNLGSNSGLAAPASIVATDVNGVQYTSSGFITSTPAGPAAFWGLRTDVQLVSVKITFTSGIQPQFDNVRYSNTALPPPGPQTPEPRSFVLLVTGLAAMWFRRSR